MTILQPPKPFNPSVSRKNIISIFSKPFHNPALLWTTGSFLFVYILTNLVLYAYTDQMYTCESDYGRHSFIFNAGPKTMRDILVPFSLGCLKTAYFMSLFKLFGTSLFVIKMVQLPFLLILAFAVYDILYQYTAKELFSFIGVLLVLNTPLVANSSRMILIDFLSVTALGLLSVDICLRDMQMKNIFRALVFGISMLLALAFHPSAYIIYLFLFAFCLIWIRGKSKYFWILFLLFLLPVKNLIGFVSWSIVHMQNIRTAHPSVFNQFLGHSFSQSLDSSILYATLSGIVMWLFARRQRSPLRLNILFIVLFYLSCLTTLLPGLLSREPVRMDCFICLWTTNIILLMIIMNSLWIENHRLTLVFRACVAGCLCWALIQVVFRADHFQMAPHRVYYFSSRHLISDDMTHIAGLFDYMDGTDRNPRDRNLRLIQGGISIYADDTHTVAAPLYDAMNWHIGRCPEIYQVQAFCSRYDIEWYPLLFDFPLNEGYRNDFPYHSDALHIKNNFVDSDPSFEYLFLTVIRRPYSDYQNDNVKGFRITYNQAENERPGLLSEEIILDRIKESNPRAFDRYFQNSRFMTKGRITGNLFLYVFRTENTAADHPVHRQSTTANNL